ncbi:MAG: hypothetical protein EPO12_17200 [Aquabacterium sp.]|nr:MAG: hypothetical protein EPO12_17200 [Aquabacterium sp.]
MERTMSDDSSWTPDFGSISGSAPAWAPKRPVRIAILGDFSGAAAAGRLDTGSALGRHKPIPVEFDSLDDAIGRLGIKPVLPIGAGGSPVELDIGELEAFHPDELYRNVELFSKLADLRKRLNNTATFAKAAAEVQKWAGGPKKRASRVSRGARARGATPAPGGTLDDFARLVGRTAVTAGRESNVDALLRDVMAPFVVAAADPKKDALVASVDKGLSDALRAVLHHPEFQNLESLWRGVDFLVRRLETGPGLQVHLFDVSAEELAADLGSADDLADSGLHKLLVGTPSQEKNGGYTYVLGLYQFEASPTHAELLGRIAKVAAQAGAPFLTGIATDGFGSRKKPPHELIAQAFGALRKLPEAAWLSLLGPRFLLRHPYGKRSDPISSFAFEEFSADAGLSGMLWGHPALLAAAVLAGPAAGGLTVDDLAFHHFVDADGDTTALPCTERWIAADASQWLGGFGIVAVQAHKGEPVARLTGLDAVNGQPLSAAGSAPKANRVQVGIGGPAPAKARPGVSVSAPAAKLGDDDGSASDDDLGSSSDDSDSSSDSGSGDADLDALLASLGGSDDGSSSPDDTPSSSDVASSDSSGDDGMDPELAALLASLG